jgi:hypothetical protein
MLEIGCGDGQMNKFIIMPIKSEEALVDKEI